MNKNLDLIERRLRTLFEKDLVVIFIGKNQKPRLIDDLIQSMRKNLRDSTTDELLSPDLFVVHVPMTDFEDWILHQNVLDQIADTLFSLGVSEGFSFKNHPSIILLEDSQVKEGNYQIIAEFSPGTESMKDTMSVTKPELIDLGDTLPKNASLVVNGNENITIDKLVFNIGRHSDNDLSLDDPHISRHHAQLRAVNQNYIIFDVGSMGGIFLNGRKILQSTLQTGDVIKIGMTTLIYIQDTTSHSQTTIISTDNGGPPQEVN